MNKAEGYPLIAVPGANKGVPNIDRYENQYFNKVESTYGGPDLRVVRIKGVDWDGSLDTELAKLQGTLEGENVRTGSILGASAGGTFAVAAFIALDLERAVSIAGRLNTTEAPGYPTQKDIRDYSPLLAESAEYVEYAFPSLREDRKKDVLAMSVRSGDELFPGESMQLPEARNVVIPVDAKNHSDGARTIFREYKEEIELFIRGSD